MTFRIIFIDGQETKTPETLSNISIADGENIFYGATVLVIRLLRLRPVCRNIELS